METPWSYRFTSEPGRAKGNLLVQVAIPQAWWWQVAAAMEKTLLEPLHACSDEWILVGARLWHQGVGWGLTESEHKTVISGFCHRDFRI